MASKIRLAAAALLSASTATNAAYNLVKDYSGQTFFDNWSYYGSYDNLTNGSSIFVRHYVRLWHAPTNGNGNVGAYIQVSCYPLTGLMN
jgi:hypothetical protein